MMFRHAIWQMGSHQSQVAFFPDMVMAVDEHGHVIPHKERMPLTPFRILQGYRRNIMSLCDDQPPETKQDS